MPTPKPDPKLQYEDLNGSARAFLASREMTMQPVPVQRDLTTALCGGYAKPEDMPAKTRDLLEDAGLLNEAIRASEMVTFVVPINETLDAGGEE